MTRTKIILLLLLAIAQNSRAQEKKNAEYYFQRGEQSLAKKEYISAQAHFNECLRLDSHYAEAYRLRGITREHLGEYSKALTDYNVYIDLKPDEAETLFSRAVLRFEAKQYLPARQDFLRLLTLPAGETNTIYFSQEKYTDANGKIFTAQGNSREHIFNYLGLIETHLKRPAVAITWLDSAIRRSPNNSSYWINRGAAKMELNDIIGATADYEQALKLEADNSLALHNLAILKEGAGKNAEAEALLTVAIEKNKNLPYPLAERAWQRLQKNDLKGALEDYNEVVRLEPKDGENYINRGLVKEKLKDFPGAGADFAKAIELDEKNQKAWLGHGNIMSKTGKWKEAIEDYTVAINLDPKYGLAYYNRAIANHSSGKPKEACEDLKKAETLAVKVDPKVKQKICK